MWKDFFYFSKSQRTGIVIMIVLIIITISLNYVLPLLTNHEETSQLAFQSEVESFRKSLVSRDSLRQVEWQIQKEERQRDYEEKYANSDWNNSNKQNATHTLFSFDPNKLDSVGFVKLGLKPYVASNILKYRKKGGLFLTKSDFSKVFGLNSEKYGELEPFITIAEKIDTVTKSNAVIQKKMIVELNSADTTLLMQVNGIGRAYAKAIVRFRNQTGGFVSVEQLNEVYGMRPESYERIRAFCTVNLDLVRKIKVNSATVERLNAHPYINFYQAKALYELRRNKGKLKDIFELQELPDFKEENIRKIKPYLSFD